MLILKGLFKTAIVLLINFAHENHRFSFKNLLCRLLFLFFVPLHVAFSGDSNIEWLHKFSAGDDLRWASPAFYDDSWDELKDKKDSRFHNIKTPSGIVWHRFHFIGETFKNITHPGLYLGRIGDADEVFLNGIKIGGEGSIGDRFVEATHVKRLYKIPEGLINLKGENILAIRIMNTYLKGGLFETPPLIGDFKDLVIEKKMGEQFHKNIEVALLTFMGLFLSFCILVFISGIRYREYFAFVIFSFIYAIVYFLDSSIFFETGLKDHTIQKLIFFLTSLLTPCMFIFSIEALKKRYSFFIKLIISASVLLPFFFLVTVKWEVYRIFVYIWVILSLIVASMIVFYVAMNIIKRNYTSWELIAIISILTSGGALWLIEVSGFTNIGDICGFSLAEFSLPSAIGLFLYTVCSRFSKTLKELKRFSDAIFTTHEIERKRISRDLHDSIGQSLSAIKLRLQMLNSALDEEKKEEKEQVKTLIENISLSIEELRNIAMDLRPSFLERVDFAEALKIHGDRFSKQTGINIYLEVSSQYTKVLQTKIRDNLYRIYQEALNNISKHSGADNARVSLKEEGNIIIMKIEDNGKGFEPITTRKGIGFDIMKERVALLGGDIEIKSIPSKGTKIKIMVPVK